MPAPEPIKAKTTPRSAPKQTAAPEEEPAETPAPEPKTTKAPKSDPEPAEDPIETPTPEPKTTKAPKSDPEPAEDPIETPTPEPIKATKTPRPAPEPAEEPAETPTPTSQQANPNTVEGLFKAAQGNLASYKSTLTENPDLVTTAHPNTGNTPLHEALVSKSPLIVLHTLTQYGTQLKNDKILTQSNKAGKTPLKIAIEKGTPRAVANVALFMRSTGLIINKEAIAATGQQKIGAGLMSDFLTKTNQMSEDQAQQHFDTISKQYDTNTNPDTLRDKINKTIDSVIGQIISGAQRR